MSDIVNISVYKFIALNDLPALQADYKARCDALGLKGTILLAPEGLNMFLAGSRSAIDAMVVHVRSDARFADLQPKESFSQHQPFKKMLVKIKPEIITVKRSVDGLLDHRAPHVDAPTLARWLQNGHDDAGREVALVDTRNAFEVDHGTFEGAVDWRVDKFSEFPAKAAEHVAEFAGKTVVTFCTGGIRCEKAALLMQQDGFEHVYQLDGGILKYFELMGQQHYNGTCFVFDERLALESTLAPEKDNQVQAPKQTMSKMKANRKAQLAQREAALVAPYNQSPETAKDKKS